VCSAKARSSRWWTPSNKWSRSSSSTKGSSTARLCGSASQASKSCTPFSIKYSRSPSFRIFPAAKYSIYYKSLDPGRGLALLPIFPFRQQFPRPSAPPQSSPLLPDRVIPGWPHPVRCISQGFPPSLGCLREQLAPGIAARELPMVSSYWYDRQRRHLLRWDKRD